MVVLARGLREIIKEIGLRLEKWYMRERLQRWPDLNFAQYHIEDFVNKAMNVAGWQM